MVQMTSLHVHVDPLNACAGRRQAIWWMWMRMNVGSRLATATTGLNAGA